jgi:hypothetical protein
MDIVLLLKLKNPYDYIQDNYFPRQMVGQKMFLFKMSLYGSASGVDLVFNGYNLKVIYKIIG